MTNYVAVQVRGNVVHIGILVEGELRTMAQCAHQGPVRHFLGIARKGDMQPHYVSAKAWKASNALTNLYGNACGGLCHVLNHVHKEYIVATNINRCKAGGGGVVSERSLQQRAGGATRLPQVMVTATTRMHR